MFIAHIDRCYSPDELNALDEEDHQPDEFSEQAYRTRQYRRATANMPKGSLRRWAFDFFEVQATWSAVAFGILVTVCILLSTIMLLVASLPEYRHSLQMAQAVFISEIICLVVFTIDILGRIYGAPSRLKFFYSSTPLHFLAV